jgi:hypothetical protein
MPRRRRPIRRLHLERLEDRTVPASHLLTDALAQPALVFSDFQTAHAAGFLATPNSFDLYKVSLNAGDQLGAAISAQTSGIALQSLLRVFDSTGKALALDDQEGGDARLTFQAATKGDYIIGVSSGGNNHFDATAEGTGQGGTTTGLYSLDLRRNPLAPGGHAQPDLAGSSFRLDQSMAAWGDQVSGTFTVENRGGAASTGFTVQLVLSSGTRFDGTDPSQQLASAILTPMPPAGLASGLSYTAHFTLQLPGTAPASFSPSGPVYIGLVIKPTDPTADSGKADKSGVHRGEDWEGLTILTPGPSGTTDLSFVDPGLNTRISGMLPGATQSWSLIVTQGGRFAAQFTTTSGDLIPRLTLSGPGGLLIQSDSGSLDQYLTAGTFTLAESTLTGTGSFQLTTEFVVAGAPFAALPASSKVYGMAAGDLTGSGLADLVVANVGDGKSDGSVTVWLNVGNGMFNQGQTLAVGVVPVSVAIADVNGDGIADLLVGNTGNNQEGPGTLSVLLGNGDGTFRTAPGNPAATPSRPVDLIVADLNGDGHPDLVIGSAYDGTVGVLFGNGDGTFHDQQLIVGTGVPNKAMNGTPYIAGVIAVDVNGDGKPDLVAVNSSTSTVTILLNQMMPGDMAVHFDVEKPPQPITVGNAPIAITATDFNGDGNVDLAVVNYFDDNVSVLLGDGHGGFQTQGSPLALAPGAGEVVSADLNGDGHPDLVVANTAYFKVFAGNTVSVLLNKGDATFEDQKAYTVGGKPVALAVADLNSDGRLDIVTANHDNANVTLLEGRGDGTFPGTAGSHPAGVALADLNGDGKPDLILANYASSTVSVALGNGDGTFQPARNIPVGSGPYAVAAVDLNGDGRPDLVVADLQSTSVSVLLGNGDGTFHKQSLYPVGSYPTALAVAALRGDGQPQDVVVVNYGDSQSPGSVSVLLGNGDGTFNNHAKTYPVGYAPQAVTLADVNGDGIPDLIVSNLKDKGGSFGSTISVLLGKGDGTFWDQQTFTNGVGIGPEALATTTTLDPQGNLYLFVANGKSDTVSVLKNTTMKQSLAVSFTPQQTIPVGSFPFALSAIERKGLAPQLIVANSGTRAHPDNHVSVLVGDGNGHLILQASLKVGSGPSALAVADLNSDTSPDVVTANFFDNTVSVLLGSGTSFTLKVAVHGPEPNNQPFLAPLLPGDAQPASVILDGSGHILFRPGLSDGTFDSPVALNVKNQIAEERPASSITVIDTATGWDIAAADLNPDATGHYAVSLYTVALGGDKRIHATRTTAFTTTLAPTGVAAGHLTAGSKLDDLMVAHYLDEQVTIAIHDNQGSFDPTKVITRPVGISPSALTLTDVNGDSLPDVVTTNQASGDISVMFNDAHQVFGYSARFRSDAGLNSLDQRGNVASPAQPVSLAANDFTGNKRNDLVVVNRGDHSFSVLVNDSHGGFLDPEIMQTASTSLGLDISDNPGPIVTGDYDADGKQDVAILMEDRAEVWVYQGHGDGTFSRSFVIGAGTDPTGLTVVPGSAPGLFDLLVGNGFGDVLRLHGDGKGHFSAHIGDNAASLDVRIRPDGTPEVLVANQQTGRVTIQALAAGGTAYAPISQLQDATNTHLAPGVVQWQALEGNTRLPDAIVMATGGNSVLVYHTTGIDHGTGSLTFDPPVAYPVGSEPVSVTVADINGDGVPDMVVADRGSNAVSILLGSVVGGRWVGTPGPRLQSGGGAPVAVALRHLNPNGTLDLVVTNSATGTMTMLPGRGQGFFDDRPASITTIPIGAGIRLSSFFGNTDRGVVLTDDGRIFRFNLDDGTSTEFTHEVQGVRALQALADGEVVAALSDGAVVDLNADGSMAGTFTALTGIPSEPSAIEVLESGQVLVTSAGSDTLFVFGTVEAPVQGGQTVVMLPETGPGGAFIEVTSSEEGSLGIIAIAGVGEANDDSSSVGPAGKRGSTTVDLSGGGGGGNADGTTETKDGNGFDAPNGDSGFDANDKLKKTDLYDRPSDIDEDGMSSLNRGDEFRQFADVIAADDAITAATSSTPTGPTGERPRTANESAKLEEMLPSPEAVPPIPEQDLTNRSSGLENSIPAMNEVPHEQSRDISRPADVLFSLAPGDGSWRWSLLATAAVVGVVSWADPMRRLSVLRTCSDGARFLPGAKG